MSGSGGGGGDDKEFETILKQECKYKFRVFGMSLQEGASEAKRRRDGLEWGRENHHPTHTQRNASLARSSPSVCLHSSSSSSSNSSN